jgi:hypothetical protein
MANRTARNLTYEGLGQRAQQILDMLRGERIGLADTLGISIALYDACIRHAYGPDAAEAFKRLNRELGNGKYHQQLKHKWEQVNR